MSFGVPEADRILTHPSLASSARDGNNGAFKLSSCEPGWLLFCIASDGLGWEHVSVHAFRDGKNRIPSWKEMCFIKDTFWEPEDVVMQLHPAASQYVNRHNETLHLWRPLHDEIPTPPSVMVG